MQNAMQKYWKRNVGWMIRLLAVWALASYGCGIVFVTILNQFHLGGFPLGFWFAQQGSIYVFVLLVLLYYLVMSRLDREFDVHE